MEIMREAKYGRAGNDCWITDYCCIVRFDKDLYVLILANTVYGSWTGNPKITTTKEFDNFDEADKCMFSICEKWVE